MPSPVAELIKLEEANTDSLILYPNGNFYNAYEASAWLLHTFFWTDIKIMYKEIKPGHEYVWCGFPLESLKTNIMPKVKKMNLHADYQKIKGQDACLVKVHPLKLDREAFVKWRSEYLSDYQRVKNLMQPFYGSMPLYKNTYDLFNELTHIVHHMPRNLRECLGDQIMNAITQANRSFFVMLRTQDLAAHLQKLDQVDLDVDTVVFLSRLFIDQKHLDLERQTQLMTKYASMRRQLHLYRQAKQKELAKAQAANAALAKTHDVTGQ